MVKNKLYLKGCPKCGGDMYLDKDYYGLFKMCLQCGKVVDLDERQINPIEAGAA